MFDTHVAGEPRDENRQLLLFHIGGIDHDGLDLVGGQVVVVLNGGPEGDTHPLRDDTQLASETLATGFDIDGDGLLNELADGKEDPQAVYGGTDTTVLLPHGLKGQRIPTAVGDIPDHGIGSVDRRDPRQRRRVAIKPYRIGLNQRGARETPLSGIVELDITQDGQIGFALPLGELDAHGLDGGADALDPRHPCLLHDVVKQQAVHFHHRVGLDKKPVRLVVEGTLERHGLEGVRVNGHRQQRVGLDYDITRRIEPTPLYTHSKRVVTVLGHGGHQPYNGREQQNNPKRPMPEHS